MSFYAQPRRDSDEFNKEDDYISHLQDDYGNDELRTNTSVEAQSKIVEAEEVTVNTYSNNVDNLNHNNNLNEVNTRDIVDNTQLDRANKVILTENDKLNDRDGNDGEIDEIVRKYDVQNSSINNVADDTRANEIIVQKETNNNNNHLQNAENRECPAGELKNVDDIKSTPPADDIFNNDCPTASEIVTVARDDNQSDEATDVEDDYTITEDQKRAMLELEMLKRELDYVETDPPEYNVKERLKVLNQELENEPNAEREKRASRVMFKDDLVDLIVPPCDENHESENEENKEKLNTDDLSVVAKGSQKVLVEREGRFELVHTTEITALESASAEEVFEEDIRPAGDEVKEVRSPQPPDYPRPQTADGSQIASKVKARRVRSAPLCASGDVESEYHSPYGLSPEQKAVLNKQKTERLKTQRDAEIAQRANEDDLRKKNEEAFHAWLLKKRHDVRKKQRERRKSIENRALPPDVVENVFDTWLAQKIEQKKEMKLLQKREEMENMKYCVKRTREEINTAYKNWLRQKAYEAKKAHLIELMRNRARYLIMKRQKKIDAARRRGHKLHSHSADGYRF